MFHFASILREKPWKFQVAMTCLSYLTLKLILKIGCDSADRIHMAHWLDFVKMVINLHVP